MRPPCRQQAIGVGVAVTVAVGVVVGNGVSVGVAVGLGEAVAVAVALGAGVGLAVGEDTGLGLALLGASTPSVQAPNNAVRHTMAVRIDRLWLNKRI